LEKRSKFDDVIKICVVSFDYYGSAMVHGVLGFVGNINNDANVWIVFDNLKGNQFSDFNVIETFEDLMLHVSYFPFVTE
jgi:hypothetical protein